MNFVRSSSVEFRAFFLLYRSDVNDWRGLESCKMNISRAWKTAVFSSPIGISWSESADFMRFRQFGIILLQKLGSSSCFDWVADVQISWLSCFAKFEREKTDKIKSSKKSFSRDSAETPNNLSNFLWDFTPSLFAFNFNFFLLCTSHIAHSGKESEAAEKSWHSRIFHASISTFFLILTSWSIKNTKQRESEVKMIFLRVFHIKQRAVSEQQTSVREEASVMKKVRVFHEF